MQPTTPPRPCCGETAEVHWPIPISPAYMAELESSMADAGPAVSVELRSLGIPLVISRSALNEAAESGRFVQEFIDRTFAEIAGELRAAHSTPPGDR